MCIYDIWAIILLLGMYFQKKHPADKYLFWVATIFLLFLMAFRSDDVGPDMCTYIDSYLGTGWGYGDVMEQQPVIFAWMTFLKVLFPKEPFVFVFFTTILYMIPVIWAIKLYSKDKIGSLLSMMLLPGLWLLYIVTIRQAMAQGFILMAIIAFFEKFKNWKYISCGFLVLALLCHSTSFLIIPLVAGVYFLKLKRKTMIIAVIVSLFLTNAVANYAGNLFATLLGGFSEMDRLTGYIGSDYDNAIGRFRVYLPMSILCCYILYLNRKEEKCTFFENALFVGVIIYNLLGGLDGHLIDRFCNFFYLLAAIGALPSQKTKYPIVSLLFIAYIVRAHNAYMGDDFMTYKWIWE
mgnify:CR=1 FL=1